MPHQQACVLLWCKTNTQSHMPLDQSRKVRRTMHRERKSFWQSVLGWRNSGREVTVQSDHKPLESIVKKPISKASPWLQLMLLWLLKYNVKLNYVPGKYMYMYIADTLRRANSDSSGGEREHSFERDMDLLVHSLVTHLPDSQERLQQLKWLLQQMKSCRFSSQLTRKDGQNTNTAVLWHSDHTGLLGVRFTRLTALCLSVSVCLFRQSWGKKC